MARAKKRKKKLRTRRDQVREHAKMAELLLPPPIKNVPGYTKIYYESFRSKLFHACRVAHHKNCPRTSEQGHDHFYCSCPCHLKHLTRYEKRKRLKVLLAVEAKNKTLSRPRLPGQPRVRTPGVRGQSKRFRFVKALEIIPKGIMTIVHTAIRDMKEASILELLDHTEAEIQKISKQNPQVQTSIMIHRLLKAGVVQEIE